jgi:S-(hydroxymethyl)glutathione dehydrogenase / alcohol dehydrogenase
MVRAAIFERPGQVLVLEEIEIAEPQEGEVLVRTLFSGVCHSDYHVLLGEWTMPVPLVLGHEGAGIVEKVGAGVTNISEGDHVILSWTPTCRRCRFCVSGRPQLCELAASTAYLSRLPSGETPLRWGGEELFPFLGVGSFSQAAVVTESAVIPIRKDMPLDKAALIGCAVVTGVGSVFNTARIHAGSQVVVIGCGGVGLSVVQGARLAGASRIIAVDVHEDALDRAAKLGATATVNSSKEDPRVRVPELTAPGAPDYVFEAIGKTSTIELAYELTGVGGTTMVVGQVATGEMVQIDPYILSEQEKVLRGSNYGSARASIDFPLMVELYMSGALDLDSLVSKVRPLSEVNAAFEDMEAGGVARTVLSLED